VNPRNPHGKADTSADMASRLIDRWFPCAAVDEAVKTSAGSGRSEKALFTWFASRPIAQARAAVLATLLPDDNGLQQDVDLAVRSGDPSSLARLRKVINEQYPDGRPVVLDVFSGRGIIPLEAARLGITAVGTDLSPVATLGGRLLADYPLRDWSTEPPLPFDTASDDDETLFADQEPRLLRDVRTVLAEVDRRVADKVASLFPKDATGSFPWAYLWAVTIPCDQCKRPFPLVGNTTLRHPYKKTKDTGQSFRFIVEGEAWHVEIHEGTATQAPTFAAASGKKGKNAHCLFCGHVHGLDAVKAKGAIGEFRDALIAVADGGDTPRKEWRSPRDDEIATAEGVELGAQEPFGTLTAVPTEPIPAGNQDTIRASAYGYSTYGDLMNDRQTLHFVETVRTIREVRGKLLAAGLSENYANTLTAYAAANLPRKLRRATRGAKLLSHGESGGSKQNRVQVGDVFSDESKQSFNFDYLEAGPGAGPGTWSSVSTSGINALKKILEESPSGSPGRMRQASAVALPFRDGTVDAVVTDPPYYNMIDYSDASDLFHVWLKRCLHDVLPDLFGSEGLQDKSEEIIVKRGGAADEHRTRDFYERMLSRAFSEARRVLRSDGHLVVVFGHSDPNAWLRLLGALQDAGFVVTSSWPSRTETAATGVASIKVTVTIGCRVAPATLPVATAAQVDREVTEAVKAACLEWDRDGLALTDQLMASYGPAMAVYGRYSRVLKPDGTSADIDRYLTLARTAVRDATALRLDELPLETFDAATRFAVFWQRLYARGVVPKGEARFLAQADNLRLEDLRGPLLTESKAGFKLRLDQPTSITARSSTFETARAMAAAWDAGGTEAVAEVIAAADRSPNDAHLWAVVAEISRQLPDSDQISKALAAIVRNTGTIGNLVYRAAETGTGKDGQLMLPKTIEEIYP
jgi:adenine-specific DNA methylase